METILVVEDMESLGQMLSQALQTEGYAVILAKDGREGIAKIREETMDLVVTDLKLPHKSGLDILHAVREQNPNLPVILMTAYGSIETAVKAVKEGAYDFLTKPFDPDSLILQIKKALDRQRLITENTILKEALTHQLGVPTIIGKAPILLSAVEQIRKVAPGRTTVFLTGESGTGKELFARAVHALSPRHDKPMVAINCAAIPHGLLESELFGHERGAFTGAVGRKTGKFELADQGTLFMDEIGEMDLSLQAKLLRVLEEHELMRVGGVTTVKIDVRMVVATNKDLTQLLQQKLFREDLYYRLNGFPVAIPPLRERREDIPALVDHFIAHYAKEMKKGVKTVSPEAMALLTSHPWPGNIRELRNSIERAMIFCDGEVLYPGHLGLRRKVPSGISFRDIPMEGTLQYVSSQASQLVESRMIAKVLEETGGNKTLAARKLKVSYKTLLTKIKAYGIEKVD